MGAPAGLLLPATSAGTSASAAVSAPGAAAHEDAADKTPHTSLWSHEAEGKNMILLLHLTKKYLI